MPGGSGSLGASENIVVNTTTPIVTGVSATTPNATYGLGKRIAITVGFSEAVDVSGTPVLALNDAGTATYSSGSGTTTLTFIYTVAAGQDVSRLDELSTTALSLNGGTIVDGFGNPANLTLPATGATDSLGADTDITIDTVAPTVIGVTSTTTSGDYTVGKVLTILVSFSEPVVVTGTPVLALNDGGVAYDSGGNDSSTLTFTYTVAAGQNVSRLDEASTTALSSSGGTIVDVYGNPAILTLPPPGGSNSLGANTNITIDTTAPTVTGVSSTTANGTYGTGAYIWITVGFSKPVYLSGSNAGLYLNDPYPAIGYFAMAWYAGGSGTNTIDFLLTVPAGGYVNPLDELATNAIEGSFVDAAGNVANVTVPAPGTPGSLGVNKDIIIDARSPTVTGLTSPDANQSFSPGQVVPITISFNKPVSVTGTPELSLNDGGVAVYSGGSGTSTLTFNYTVTNPQYTLRLDAASSTALTFNGGTIKDSLGNTANLTLPAPGMPARSAPPRTSPSSTTTTSSPAGCTRSTWAGPVHRRR